MQRVEKATSELVRVLLPTLSKRLAERSEVLDESNRRKRSTAGIQRANNVLAHLVERAEASSRRFVRFMLTIQSKIRQRRRVRQALQHRVEEACVPEVCQASTRAAWSTPLHAHIAQVV